MDRGMLKKHAVSIFRVEACRAWLYQQVGWKVVTQTHTRESNWAWQKPICREHRKTALFMHTLCLREMELWEKTAMFRDTILYFIR
jgi:hypothetical protein